MAKPLSESTHNLYVRALHALGVRKRHERIIVTAVMILFFGAFAYLPARELVNWQVKKHREESAKREEFVSALNHSSSVVSALKKEGAAGVHYERFHDLYSSYTLALNETQRAWGKADYPDSMQALFAIHMKLNDVDEAWKKVIFHKDDSRQGRVTKAILDMTLLHQTKELNELLDRYDPEQILRE